MNDMSDHAARSHPFDERLAAFWQMALGFVPEDDLSEGVYADRLALDMPIEFEIQTDVDGTVSIGSAPPTQSVRTSVMPVFHRMRMTLTRS